MKATSSQKLNFKNAVQKINEQGVLLVFPVNNAKEPASLWSQFFPRTPMRWDWNEDSDNRVGKLWMLMKELSSSGEVVYSKWYQGRATFFSKEVFTALLCVGRNNFNSQEGLSRAARGILDTLESDSPLSTKQLKKMTELQGKDNEKFYVRAMKDLFNKFLIVAFGEVDDGAFPSLAVGATRHLFEELRLESLEMKPEVARGILDKALKPGSLFRRYYDKTTLKSL